MSILIKGLPLGGYEISIMKDGERYRARVDGIWCEVEEIPTTDTDSDTISRAKAIDALMDALDDVGVLDAEDINTVFRMLPPIQPEIIRCKDCKYWVPGYITDNDDFIPPKCREWQQMVGHSSDDYCSLAERREDE